MLARTTPYGAFNFVVTFDRQEVFGGFSDMSGMSTDVKVSEYRNGNDRENHVRKIAGVHTVSDVTLKRGVINSRSLFAWINQVRHDRAGGKKVVKITLRNERGEDVQSWVLRGTIPLKYTAPTLAAKGGGDAAIEELVLSAEALDLE